MERQGYRLLSSSGKAVTSAQLKEMGRAQINLVTTASGLAAARYLKDRFGTPYVACAPFGIEQCGKLADPLTAPCLPKSIESETVDTLIIGEQFTANALREALESKGISSGAQVATFFQLDKGFARSGDCKIKGESGVRECSTAENTA